MRLPLLSSLFIVLVLTGPGCGEESYVYPTVPLEPVVDPVPERNVEIWSQPSVLPAEEIHGKQVRITTAKGEIVFELFDETAPLTVSNFVHLAQNKYFDGLTFHRRVEDFVIQGGDPDGDGTGGPGYTFVDELEDSYTYDRGIVAMANRGPNTNGSQFFIMLADNPLPKNYTIFGRVLSGMEVVDQIKIGDVMTSVTIEDKTE